ncbi:FMN2 family protein [Megaselia abdita]
MAVHLRNKIAQAFGVGGSSEDTLNRNGTIASSVGGGIGGASGDMGLFNISRAKKVELQTLSSRISDAGLTASMDTLVASATMKTSSSTDNQSSILLGLKHPSSPLLISSLPNFSDPELPQNNNNNYYNNGINNNNTINNNNNNNCSGNNRMQLQLQSNNVLKKVASFTANNSSSSPSDKQKTHYIPEKLSFGDYEKFEGQMLIKWFVSSFHLESRSSLNELDLNHLAQQCCSNLLSVGVIRQISSAATTNHSTGTDNNVDKFDLETFYPFEMYEWTHRQRNTSIHLHSSGLAPLTPGKLDRELTWQHCNNCLTTGIAPTVTTTTAKISKSTQVDRSIRLLERCASNDFLNSSSSTPNQKDSNSRMNKWKESLNSCDSLVEFVRTIELIMEDTQDFRIRRRIGDDILDETEVTLYDGNDFNLDCDDSSNICCKCTNTKVTVDKEIQTTPLREISVPVKQVLEALEIPLSNKSTIPPPPPMPLDLTPVTTRCHRIIKKEDVTQPPPPPPPPPPPLPNGIGSPMPKFGIPPPPPLPPNTPTRTAALPIPPPPPPMPSSITPSRHNFTPCGMLASPSMVPTTPKTAPSPAPLPPIPPGGWFKPVAPMRKVAVNPPKPMRPLYWTRILAPRADVVETNDDDADETDSSVSKKHLWQEIDETSLDNMNEFTELFSRQPIEPKQKTDTIKPVKIKNIKILDSKRSQNVGIFARSLHVDIEDIEQAIYNIDTSVVNLDILQHILVIRGTSEELEAIRRAADGEVPLDAPEQFLLKIDQISYSSDRISCIILRHDFDEISNGFCRRLTNLQQLSEYLICSENLKNLFSIILTLGNYMNGGNRVRGQADGFGLEILGKLRDVKSKDNKITLLHFIVKTYISKHRTEGVALQDIALPIPEPCDIEKAYHTDFDEVKEKINSLRKKINLCKETVERVVSSSNENQIEPFQSKMTEFIAMASERIDKLDGKLEECRQLFIKVMKFYHFMPKSTTLEQCTPGQFFEFWLSFTSDFKDIWKKEIIHISNEMLRKTKMKQQQRLAASLPSPQKRDKGKSGGLKHRLFKLGNKS